MNLSSVRDRLKDVVVTNVTPFSAEGTLDVTAVGRQATYMVDRGINVIVAGGNTGEYTSLTLDEANAVTATVVQAVGDRATVLAGVGWSSGYAIEQAQQAEAAGAQGIMVHHPVHTYINREALRGYYERILDSVGIGVVLYKRGPEFTDALIGELVHHPRVVGVKYAVNDVNAFANLVADSTDDVAWVCGTAERWAPFFALAGAHGFSSGLANVMPRETLELRNALRSEDWGLAMKMRAELTPLEELRQNNWAGNNVPVIKEGLRLVGLDTGTVREPLGDLDNGDKTVVSEQLNKLGYIQS